jgi:hypothetical protein
MITFGIEVLRKDEGEDEDALLEGTFKQPFPWARIRTGACVRWRIRRGRRGDKFTLRFINGSPFGEQQEVTESTEPLRVTQKGTFKYEVDVVDAKTGTKYSILHCPVLQSDD